MHLTYMDESGGISFSEKSIYKYFSITTLTINESIENKIKNTMRAKKTKLYKLGWPRDVEIKANTLHNLRRNKKLCTCLKETVNGDEYIKEVLTSIKNSCQPRIDYLVVYKEKIKDESFKSANYGIAYNFFSGKLLIPLVKDLKECKVFVDPRNKERHSKKHFESYIKTEIMKIIIDEQIDIKCDIEQPYSHMNLGLQAVDFFSWSIYRKFASKDSRYYNIFSGLMNIKQEWYCEKE